MIDMTSTEITTLLASARIGRLAMADKAGRPYAIPLPFCFADGAIYLRLPLRGRKGHILAQNDQVCFEVDIYSETLDDYASVLAEGRLAPVLDPREKSRVKQINEEKYLRLRNGHRPGHNRPTPLEDMPLQKISVQILGGRKKDPPAASHLSV